jgi:iron complex outermembrane receptor protein
MLIGYVLPLMAAARRNAAYLSGPMAAWTSGTASTDILPGSPARTDTLPGSPPLRVTDTLRRVANPLKRVSDTLREIHILGEKPLTERKLDRTIVHVDALLANTGGHAWDVLENTPGVTLDEEGAISLNGKDGVLVLIDDRPTYLSTGQLMNYLKTLPASQIEQIELLPTPPARYPASGSAGIIIIRTKRAKTDGLQAQFSSTYAQGVYPKVDQSLSLNGQHGAWQFTVLAGYSYTQNFFSSDRYRNYFNTDGSTAGLVAQDYFEESWQQGVNYSVGLEHKGSPGHKGSSPYKGSPRHEGSTPPVAFTSWGFLFEGSQTPYHEWGNYTNGYYDGQGRIDSISKTHSQFRSQSPDLNLNAHILRTLSHKGRTLSADADFVRYSQNSQQTEGTATTRSGDTTASLFDLVSTQPFTAHIYGLKTDYTDRFGPHTYLEAGLQSTWSLRQSTGNYLEGPPGSLSPNDSLNNTFRYDEQIRSAYISLRREQKRVALQAGLRMENTLGKGLSTGDLDSSFRLSYTNLFPSLHALWSPDSNKRHQIGFTYSRRIDRPDYGDLNPSRFFRDQYTYFSGNPALQPEFSQNAELSYTYLNRFTLTGAYSSVRGSINQVFIADGADFYYYSINMDRQVTAGLRADVSTPLTAHWSLNTHAEWMYKQYKTELPTGEFLNKTQPSFLLSGSTRYSFTGGWSAEVSGLYRTNTLLAQSILRPTGRLNLALRKKIMKNKVTLTINGNDVLRTAVIARYIYLPNALVYFDNRFDRRQVAFTFAYTFGRSVDKIAEHTGGAASEKARL